MRTLGPGLPYPDPEFTAPAMQAVNATLAQQTGYCEGVSPLHGIPIGPCNGATTQCQLCSDVLYLNLCSKSWPVVGQYATLCASAPGPQFKASGRDHHCLAGTCLSFAYMVAIDCLWMIYCFGVPAVTQTPPVQTVGPHVATLGMKFYTGDTSYLRADDQQFRAEQSCPCMTQF